MESERDAAASLRRCRLAYLAMALATIAAGLLVHRGGGALPASIRDKLGDALWAAMMFWWVSAALPRVGPGGRAAVALAICAAVEGSQLLHASWLDDVRATTIGGLVLGSGFDGWDLLAYGIGVVGAAGVEVMGRGFARRG